MTCEIVAAPAAIAQMLSAGPINPREVQQFRAECYYRAFAAWLEAFRHIFIYHRLDGEAASSIDHRPIHRY